MKSTLPPRYSCRFSFLPVLFSLLVAVQPVFADVDITGSWNIDIFTTAGLSSHQTWQLTQSVSDVTGSGTAGAATFSTEGSIILDVLGCSNTYDNSPTSYEQDFGGIITPDSNSITGSWFDTDSNAGTWFASRVGTTAALTPQTKINTPPVITVKHETATFTLRKFGKVLLSALRARKASPVRLSIQYEVDLKDMKRHNQLKQVSAKNTVTIRNLSPGNYTARYRVSGLENGKKVFTTNQSPAGAFTIRK